jgi:hypothetical protein
VNKRTIPAPSKKTTETKPVDFISSTNQFIFEINQEFNFSSRKETEDFNEWDRLNDNLLKNINTVSANQLSPFEGFL